MALSISSLGAYFYVLNVLGKDEANKISFLPLPSLCIYVLAFSLGFGAIPWLMMSELMAPEVKSISSSIAGRKEIVQSIFLMYLSLFYDAHVFICI